MVLYVLALVIIVVGVDVLFFRHYFWERLIVNVGMVLVSGVLFEVPEALISIFVTSRRSWHSLARC